MKTRFEIAALASKASLIFSGRRSCSARRCEHFSHGLIVLGCSRPFFLTSLPLCCLLQHLAPALLLLIVRRCAERFPRGIFSLYIIYLPGSRPASTTCRLHHGARQNNHNELDTLGGSYTYIYWNALNQPLCQTLDKGCGSFSLFFGSFLFRRGTQLRCEIKALN